MLKVLRSSKFFTVLILGAITIIITIAFIFYGIGPNINPSTTAIAQVGKEKITIGEYEQAYVAAYRRAQEKYPNEEEIKKLNLKERVLVELIDNIALLSAAKKAGLRVTKDEIQTVITNEPIFQINGVFNKEVYLRRLKLNHITATTYERAIEQELLLNKMRMLIIETAFLTPDEKKMLDSISGNREQFANIILSAKREMAIKAYVEGLKRQMEITINKELLS